MGSRVPANPLVEFEIQPATGGTASTFDATRVGTDTWEAFVSISNLDDLQQYTLRAILYANFTGPGTGEEVAVTEELVTVNRSDVPPPPPANTVEILYPSNGDPTGFHSPEGKRTNALMDVVVSEGTEQVRVLYTVSRPGTTPEWVSCGSGGVGTVNTLTIRCTLAEGVVATQVTALAAAANNTPPPSTPNAAADATGDAHRVAPYFQKTTVLDVDPESLRVEVGSCLPLIARATDQFGRPIAGANIDVHATGPGDQVRFGFIENTATSPSTTPTGAFQAPDKGHVATRDGIQCRTKANSGKQGDHNIPGAPDPQHIESTTGTDDAGRFIFALYSDVIGGTSVTVSADENDDDVFQGSEVTGGSRLGWGQDPPEPTTDVFLEPASATGTSGSCVRMVLSVKRGGNALSGVNVDVHVNGPDSGVAFCSPPDGSAGRAPDQNHVGGVDDDDTRHLEGETDSVGRFIFGVTSTSSGTTGVVGWMDVADDDVPSLDEPSKNSEIAWTTSGERSISIQSNKSTANKGSRARISGAIDGASACESGQAVKLKAKRVNRGKFRTIASTTTEGSGSYKFNVVVRISKKYRTVAPVAGACEKATSRVITIRAN